MFTYCYFDMELIIGIGILELEFFKLELELICCNCSVIGTGIDII